MFGRKFPTMQFDGKTIEPRARVCAVCQQPVPHETAKLVEVHDVETIDELNARLAAAGSIA